MDDRDLGPVARARDGLVLAVGLHRIELRENGYYPFYAEVELPAGELRRLHADLRSELDAP